MQEPERGAIPKGGRVLAVRLSALGDVVKAIPAMRALASARPDLRIEWLTEDRHAELVDSLTFVEHTWVFPRKGWIHPRGWIRMARHLGDFAGRRWDAVLDFQANSKSRFQLALTRSGTQVSRDSSAPSRQSAVERDADLVRSLGIAVEATAPWKWALPDGLKTEEMGTEGERPVLLLPDTTPYGRDKAWPDSRWVALAQGLRSEGIPVQFLQPPNNSRAAILAAQADCAIAPSTPSLPELAALLDGCRAVVGTDSGPVHLAAYRGTPAVALFGPTDPAVHAPFGPAVLVLSPLSKGEAPPPRDRSRPSPLMEEIQVDTVQAAVLKISG